MNMSEPLTLRIATFLQEYPECTKVVEDTSLLDDSYFVERFMLEIIRGEKPVRAQEIAKTASQAQNKITNPLQEIEVAMLRFPKTLLPGEHVKEGPLTLVNLDGTEPILFASEELFNIFSEAKRKPTTLVFEADAMFQIQKSKNQEKEIITLDPADNEITRKLREHWGQSDDSQTGRELFTQTKKLETEYEAQLRRVREFIIEYLSASVFYENEKDLVLEVSEETAILVVDELEKQVELLAKHPRVVLPINWSTLIDLEPTTPWEEDPIRLRAVANAVTRDNPEIDALIRQYPHLRSSYIGLTHKPELVEGLFSPPVHATVSLKEECLDHALFFPTVFAPQSTLHIPCRGTGYYQSVVTSAGLLDLLKIKCLLQFTMAEDASIINYMRGFSKGFRLRESSSRPLTYLLQKMAPFFEKGKEVDKKILSESARIAIAMSAYRGLGNPDGLGVIGCLYYGPLTFNEVARVEIETSTPQEYVAYQRQGKYSQDMQEAAHFYGSTGVEFIVKPPIDSPLVHMLGMTQLLGEPYGEDF